MFKNKRLKIFLKKTIFPCLTLVNKLLPKNDKVIYVNSIKNVKKAKDLASYKLSQKEYLIACAHQMAPLIEYDIKKGKTIYILLTGDMVIPQNEEYFNLRTKEKSILEEDI